ncbi:MAG: 50S ribosomal protein L13 [bacterium]|nr:50S ribosomal protein L13 [bacterium]
MKTMSAKKSDMDHKWFLADAEGKVLGRFASEVAKILKGKHKPVYTTHVDTGDHVVIINAEKIRVTGSNKMEQKVYTSYSGYPGGLKKVTLQDALEKKPEFVLQHAIKGMLPRTKLGRQMMRKVRIYSGSEHPHEAQAPENIELA